MRIRTGCPWWQGVTSSNTMEACRQAREFEAMGVDGILSILDVYFPVKPREVEEYYASVAKSVSCPIVLYNNPRFMKFNLEADTLEALCRILTSNITRMPRG